MKVLNKKSASLAMAAVFAAGGMGVAKIIAGGLVSASAQARSGYAFSADAEIGTGESNKATVSVSSSRPAVLAMSGVPAGQYYFVLKTENGRDDYPGITVQVDDYYAFLTYNSYADAYIAIVETNGNSIINLTTYSYEAQTADVWLDELFIGESTQYAVYGLKVGGGFSGRVRIADVAAMEYFVRLQPYDRYGEDIKFYFGLDGGNPSEMIYDENSDGYAVNASIGGSSEYLTVTSTSGEAVTVDLILDASVIVDTPLPANSPAEFAQYETRSFVYRAEQTGYYTINHISAPAAAEFGITLKTNPNLSQSVSVYGENFPMYLVGNTNYYFDITYIGIAGESYENMPATVKATFSVNRWENPAANVDKNMYVPVTSESDSKTVPIKINCPAGSELQVSLYNVPFGAEHISLHYANDVITLASATGFATRMVVQSGADSFYFTADYEGEFVADLLISYVPVSYDGEMKLGKGTEVTLRAHESRLYYVTDIPAGEYKITTAGGNGKISAADEYGGTIIAAGEGLGYVDFAPSEPSGTLYFSFSNESDENITFAALVTAMPSEEIFLGEAKQITLAANESAQYRVNIEEGDYTITLSDADPSAVRIYFDEEEFIFSGLPSYDFSVSGGEHIITVNNKSGGELTFTVILTVYI